MKQANRKMVDKSEGKLILCTFSQICKTWTALKKILFKEDPTHLGQVSHGQVTQP